MKFPYLVVNYGPSANMGEVNAIHHFLIYKRVPHETNRLTEWQYKDRDIVVYRNDRSAHVAINFDTLYFFVERFEKTESLRKLKVGDLLVNQRTRAGFKVLEIAKGDEGENQYLVEGTNFRHHGWMAYAWLLAPEMKIILVGETRNEA